MATFRCKMCGGDLQISLESKICTCEYCGMQQTLPHLDSEKKENLYARANHLRRNNDFDKAIHIYETILNEDTEDAEAYWSLVLCRYGIEYVEDSITHKQIPTCHRTQFSSILIDPDYKKALEYADYEQRQLYEKEATQIDQIQKEILAISQKEAPFDVFICYKESDNLGNRTLDSVLAQDIYYQLVNEGYKVFFSRITLEDKLGQAYEPYIFSALNSSKVMIVIGTKSEHFNAVWVKNEWSRFLTMIKKGEKKILIPAYRDMDPYDIPEEFSHLQAQDMSKIGFIQDLIRGVNKVCKKENENVSTLNVSNISTEIPIIKRALLSIEDGDFRKAEELLDNALNINPENADIYTAQLMIYYGVKNFDDLRFLENSLDENPYYIKAIRFADVQLQEKLKNINIEIIERLTKKEKEATEKILKEMYLELCETLTNLKNFSDIDLVTKLESLSSLENYKDSSEKLTLIKEHLYNNISKRLNTISKSSQVPFILSLLNALEGYKDCNEKKEWLISQKKRLIKAENKKMNSLLIKIVLVIVCAIILIIVQKTIQYNKMQKYIETGYLGKAYEISQNLENYRDCADITNNLYQQLEESYQKTLYINLNSLTTENRVQMSMLMEKIMPYKDVEERKASIDQFLESEYQKALDLYKTKSYSEALSIFEPLKGYKDTDKYIENCNDCSITGHLYEKKYCFKNSVCARCNDIKEDATECIPGPEATCTEKQICQVCSYIIAHKIKHNFTERCGDTLICSGCGKHLWDNHYTCTECGETLCQIRDDSKSYIELSLYPYYNSRYDWEVDITPLIDVPTKQIYKIIYYDDDSTETSLVISFKELEGLHLIDYIRINDCKKIVYYVED